MPQIAQIEVERPNFGRRYYETVRSAKLASAIGRLSLESYTNIEQRRYDELVSGIAEALKPESLTTAINTHYSFELSDEKLVAKDGEVIEEMLLKALEADRNLAASDSFFEPFIVKRSRHELEEHREQNAVANGRTSYNTIVTFSPYSAEYDDGSEEIQKKLIQAGQKPYWKRTMIRVSHWDGNAMHILTRSIDNSDVELLKETAGRSIGYQFVAQDSTAMLGERIRLDIKDNSWQNLAHALTKTADTILSERYGGSWLQGNPELNVKDVQAYVESQKSIVKNLINKGDHLAWQYSSFETYKKAFDNELYNCIALLEKRLELGRTEEDVLDYEAAATGAGAIARAENKSYDMCGYVLNSGNEANLAQQTGFESLTRLVGKPVECPFCEKKVVVATADLDNGKLYCKECDTGVDVCTGQRFRRGISKTKATSKQSFLNPIAKEMAQIDMNLKNKREARKREQTEKLKTA